MRNLGFSLIIFILFLLISEGSFRIYFHFNNPNPHQSIDNKLGWKVNENINIELNEEGIGKVNFKAFDYGFRKWGNINTKKKKLLIVGDSYTEAMQISNGKCYYDYIDSTKYEVFAFGCGGYGTLQEYLAVDSLINIISPDLMIWQFCHNDLINNSLELEKVSYVNNYLMRKPYYINGEIVNTTPHKSSFLAWIESISKLALWTHLKTNNILWRYYGSIETEFDRYDIRFKKSFETTKAIYTKIKQKNIKTAVFSVTTSYGYDEISSICTELDIPFISKINSKLDIISSSGVKINFQPYDWHWNELGHKLAGQILNKEVDKLILEDD